VRYAGAKQLYILLKEQLYYGKVHLLAVPTCVSMPQNVVTTYVSMPQNSVPSCVSMPQNVVPTYVSMPQNSVPSCVSMP
jgi:hypothetical protein